MSGRLLRTLPALAALALAACGGGGGDGGNSGGGSSSADDAELRRIIHSTSESKDPSKCEKLATPRFLEQMELQKGSKAVDSCKKSTKTDVPADSVDIEKLKIGGTTATAVYTQHGGDSDNQTFTVEFVKTGGHWRFDHLAALDIDRKSFEKSMRASLIRPPNALGPAVADCSIKELKKTSDTEIENAVVQSKAGVLIRPIAICAVAGELRKAKLPESQVECASRKTIDALSDAELEATLSGATGESKVQSSLRKALTACGSSGTI
jgi:hypothetical protein